MLDNEHNYTDDATPRSLSAQNDHNAPPNRTVALPAPPAGKPVTGLPSPTDTTLALPDPTACRVPATTTPPPSAVLPTSAAVGPAVLRSFAGVLVDGDFLVNPLGLVQIVQYLDGQTVIWQAGSMIASLSPSHVLSLGYETRQSYVRVTPGWAIAVGILGLLFFLIGIVFFFIKETQPVVIRVLTLRLTDGRHLTITQP